MVGVILFFAIVSISNAQLSLFMINMQTQAMIPITVDLNATVGDLADAVLHDINSGLSDECIGSGARALSIFYGGVELMDQSQPLADVGLSNEARLSYQYAMNDLRLFDVSIANTTSRMEVWSQMTDYCFTSYQEFADHHNQNYAAMMHEMEGSFTASLQFSSDGDIIEIDLFRAGFDFAGIDLAPFAEMKSLRNLYLSGCNLGSIDLSPLPRLRELKELDLSYNPQLQRLQFPFGMEDSKLKEILMDDCGIEELDLTNLNCVPGPLRLDVDRRTRILNGDDFTTDTGDWSCDYFSQAIHVFTH